METQKNIFKYQQRFWKIPQNSSCNLRVVNYNVLSSSLITPDKYRQQKPYQLDSQNRYQLISNELSYGNPDVCLMQEVCNEDMEEFKDFFEKSKMIYNYQGKQTHNLEHGNLIAFKTEKFTRKMSHFCCFFLNPNNYQEQNILQQELYHGTNAIFELLQEKDSQKNILFITTHLPYNLNRGHLKLGCLIIILKCIQKIKMSFQVDDIIFGGDFNLVPNSMIYNFITTGNLLLSCDLVEYSNQKMINKLENLEPYKKFNIQDNKFKPYDKFNNKKLIDQKFLSLLTQLQVKIENGKEEIIFEQPQQEQLDINQCQVILQDLMQEMKFQSAFSNFSKQNINEVKNYKNYEPQITFWQDKSQQCVDYQFFTNKNLKVSNVLNTLFLKQFQNMEIIPNDFFGSDHFSLWIEYNINN